VEDTADRRHAGAERPLREVRGRHAGAAVGAAHPIPELLADLRDDRRDLPDLDTGRLPLRRQGCVQGEGTGWTLDRPVLDPSGDPVGAELDPGLAGLAQLPAWCAPTACA
jgi:hypothetical protein